MARQGEDRLPESIVAALEEVREETSRGASWALYRIALGIIEASEEGEDLCSLTGLLEREVAEVAGPMMPPRWVPLVISEACKRGLDPGDAARRLIDYQSRAVELAVSNAHQALAGASRVVTLSYSSTVERALRLHARRALIIVAESLPGGEGALLAGSLESAGMSVRLVPDSALGQWLGEGTVVLLGADAVSGDGCVVNKTGSRLLAHASKSIGVPAYAVFDATKTWPFEPCESLPGKEWVYEPRDWRPVRVPVFDRVEPGALAGYITEEGILAPGGSSVRRLWRRLVDMVV